MISFRKQQWSVKGASKGDSENQNKAQVKWDQLKRNISCLHWFLLWKFQNISAALWLFISFYTLYSSMIFSMVFIFFIMSLFVGFSYFLSFQKQQNDPKDPCLVPYVFLFSLNSSTELNPLLTKWSKYLDFSFGSSFFSIGSSMSS